MDGIRQKAKLSYGFQLSKMEVASLFLPAWASVLIPTDVDVNFSGTNLNLDAPARKVIDTLDLNRDPPIPAAVTEEIAAEFKANPPKIVFAKSTIRNADTEIVAEGEMTFAEGKPVINMTFDATGYDRVLDALQATSDPHSAEILPIARLLKGYANTMPGGHLLWKVSLNAEGSVSLNNVMLKKADPAPAPQ